MVIEKLIFPKCVSFSELETGRCFMLSCNADASVFLKVNSNNSRKNAVNLTTNMLIEISSNAAVFPIKATLSISV
jgi:hypothetical protein